VKREITYPHLFVENSKGGKKTCLAPEMKLTTINQVVVVRISTGGKRDRGGGALCILPGIQGGLERKKGGTEEGSRERATTRGQEKRTIAVSIAEGRAGWKAIQKKVEQFLGKNRILTSGIASRRTIGRKLRFGKRGEKEKE